MAESQEKKLTKSQDDRPREEKTEVEIVEEQSTGLRQQAQEAVEKKWGTKAAPGSVTGEHKVKMTEELNKRAVENDQEDTREETSGYERHDLIIAKELNIPPSIVQERLRNNQNPATGEGWSKEDRQRYDKEAEQARQKHLKAVRDAEQKAREDQAAAPEQMQPVQYIPDAHLTDEQRKAQQKAQDSGKSAVGQALARDNASPDKIQEKDQANA